MTDSRRQEHTVKDLRHDHVRAERLQEELARVKRQLATCDLPVHAAVKALPPLDERDEPGELNREGTVPGAGSRDPFSGRALW